MNLDNDILDGPEEEEDWYTDRRWPVGFLLVTVLVPIIGGVIMSQIDPFDFRPIRIILVFLIMLTGVVLSGRFLAKSRTRIPVLLLSLVVLPQVFVMSMLLANGTHFFHAWANQYLISWTFNWPRFNDVYVFLGVLIYYSVYVPWLAVSICINRKIRWRPYFWLALLYSALIFLAFFVLRIFGPI